MPIIQVTLLDGYPEELRRELAGRLTDVVRMVLSAPPEGITVVLGEVPASNYMRGRQSRIPGRVPPAASQVVREYLAAMEARDLDQARRWLADEFTMEFPGGVRFRDPRELLPWARDRYRSVRKTYTRFDEAPTADAVVVHCQGTLEGEWPDGTPFAGVRFVDRFTVRDGKLLDQQVWNDLAEVRR